MAAKKKKPAKRSARKSAKAAPKKARAKKPAASLAPKPVKTGRGPGPTEIATQVFALLRDGKYREVEDGWLAPGIVSVEGAGASMAWTGKKAVLAKYRGWEADHDIHTMDVAGPWVGATGFAVKFTGDVTQKSTGQRLHLEEIAVYTVKDGKITREEFHFATGA
jgi:ketosteroid isomerase-like protein